MSDEMTLLPCPFCGGEAEVYEMQYGADGQYSVFGVFCVDDSNSELIGLSKYQHGHFIDNFPTPDEAIAAWNTRAELGSEINGDTSDGYHTFNELYHHRAVLFSVIVRDHRELAWKARKHHDGTMYEGMFIVGIETPEGQATYHYDLDPYWEMFDCEEREFAPEWDGHTPDEAIVRIAELGGGTCELIDTTSPGNDDYWNSAKCSECGAEFTCAIFGRSSDMPDADYCPNCGAKVVGI